MTEEVLAKQFSIAPNVLWKRVVEALDVVAGATLTSVDESSMQARFTTGASMTSWGENMIAHVEPSENGTSALRITGQIRHTLFTSNFGEWVHRKSFVRRLLANIRA